jgi:hypothetical protein
VAALTRRNAVSWFQFALLLALGAGLLGAGSVRAALTAQPWLALVTAIAGGALLLRGELNIANARAAVVPPRAAHIVRALRRARPRNAPSRLAAKSGWPARFWKVEVPQLIFVTEKTKGPLLWGMLRAFLFIQCVTFLYVILEGSVVLPTMALFLVLLTTNRLRSLPVYPPRGQRAVIVWFSSMRPIAFCALSVLAFLFLVDALASNAGILGFLRNGQFSALGYTMLGVLIAAPLARSLFVHLFDSDIWPENLEAISIEQVLRLGAIWLVFVAVCAFVGSPAAGRYGLSGMTALPAWGAALVLAHLNYLRILRKHYATADLI